MKYLRFLKAKNNLGCTAIRIGTKENHWLYIDYDFSEKMIYICFRNSAFFIDSRKPYIH